MIPNQHNKMLGLLAAALSADAPMDAIRSIAKPTRREKT
jgi:hypothetical protein